MRYLVSVDDTDMPGTKGTGWLVQDICKELEACGLGRCSATSRHQLYVHKDIPYTSHNSAMCFEIELDQETFFPRLMDHMIHSLETRSMDGSDPGLCVTGELSPAAQSRLTAFGRTAKQSVCTKDDAYRLASELGIHLSEHGGAGDGVIGALAGTGLRISGNDGRYRGWHHLGNAGEIRRVESLCGYPFIDAIVHPDGSDLSPSEQVVIGSEKTKTVRMGARQVVVVTDNETVRETGVALRTLTKKEAKQY